MAVGRRVVQLLKWCGPILAVLLSCAWYFSDERVFILNGPHGTQAAISGGQFMVSIDTPPLAAAEQPQTGIRDYSSEYRWWFDVVWRKTVKAFYVPLWLLVGAFAGLGGFAWRADRRARRARRRGACQSCGYDRAGLAADAPCPECGSERVAA